MREPKKQDEGAKESERGRIGGTAREGNMYRKGSGKQQDGEYKTGKGREVRKRSVCCRDRETVM